MIGIDDSNGVQTPLCEYVGDDDAGYGDSLDGGGDGDGLLDGVDGWVGLAEDVVHARSGVYGDL